ncbi:MAG: hypothetical protein ACI9FR_000499 [Cryomorphaceae bacterium]|jgi:hypothetical protein
MNIIRQRAQEHFPTVLLTLLSIVQALALELMWEHIQETPYLFDGSWQAYVSWFQIVTTLFGVVLIWVVYASNAMRFRWTPTTADSVYPFIIGLLEFWQIALLGVDDVGLWGILMAIIFAAMVLVSHLTMRNARHTGDNGSFFAESQPATIKDFASAVAAIVLLVLSGSYVWLTHNTGAAALVLILMVFALLVWQYRSTTIFWNSSVREE